MQPLPQKAAENAQASIPEDSALGNYLITLNEHVVILAWADAKTNGNGYLDGVPQDVYNYQMKLKQAISKMAAVTTEDSLRKDLISTAIDAGNQEVSAGEYFIKAIVTGQQAKSFTAQCADLQKRSIALRNLVEDTIGSTREQTITLYQQSATFKETIPVGLTYFLGINSRPSRFRLGVQTRPKNPFYLLVVHDGSVASSIGLKAGDRIVSVTGKVMEPDESIEVFKLMIQENLGKKIDTIIERDGKKQKIILQIPVKLPPESLY